jgi:hypothetical protein
VQLEVRGLAVALLDAAHAARLLADALRRSPDPT